MSNDKSSQEKFIKEWYETYEERELLKNAKKTCTFCNEVGHIVYHNDVYDWGIPICPLLKKTACSACGLIGHTPTFCEFLKCSEEITKEHLYFEIRDYVELYIDENTKMTNIDVSQNITEKEREKMVNDCIQTCMVNVAKYRKKHSKKFEKIYKRHAEYFENMKREIEQIKKRYKKDWFLRVEKTQYDTPYAEQMRKSYEIYLEEYKIWKENVADLFKERVDNHNDDDNYDDLDDLNFHEFIYDDDTPLEFIINDFDMWCLSFNEYHKKNPWYEPLLTNAWNFYSKKYLN